MYLVHQNKEYYLEEKIFCVKHNIEMDNLLLIVIVWSDINHPFCFRTHLQIEPLLHHEATMVNEQVDLLKRQLSIEVNMDI